MNDIPSRQVQSYPVGDISLFSLFVLQFIEELHVGHKSLDYKLIVEFTRLVLQEVEPYSLRRKTNAAL